MSTENDATWPLELGPEPRQPHAGTDWIVQPRTSVGEVIDKGYTDIEAVGVFLSSYQMRSEHTQRLYKRECMRFLLWLNVKMSRSGSLLRRATQEDINQYLNFVQRPRAFSEEMLREFGFSQQPFRTSLDSASVKVVVTVLNQMFSALKELDDGTGSPYVRFNPTKLLNKQLSKSTSRSRRRKPKDALTQEEWGYVQETIENLPKTTDAEKKLYHRTRWLFQLLYRLWLRRHEVVTLRMCDFVKAQTGWFVCVRGKGGVEAELVATPTLMAELLVFRTSQRKASMPTASDMSPAFPSIADSSKPVTDQTIYLTTKVIFQQTADRIRESYPESAERLLRATPHWLRHTGITHALESQIDPRYVQAQARHATLATTTSIYDHKQAHALQSAISSVF